PSSREIYTLSLHNALPICKIGQQRRETAELHVPLRLALGDLLKVLVAGQRLSGPLGPPTRNPRNTICRITDQRQVVGDRRGLDADRKSTRLNSSHVKISYA